MRTIHARALSPDAFAPYGEYCDLLAQGQGQSGFFPDRLVWQPMAEMGASVGYACPCEMRIPWYEYHAATAELRLPLDGDIVLYVGAPAQVPVESAIEAFIVPRGTMVKLAPGVIHGRQFPLGDAPVHVLLLCEAATWQNDARVWRVEGEQSPLILI